MIRKFSFGAFAGLTGLVLVAGITGANAQTAASAAILVRFDANHDNVITRAEMDAGLKADFEAADTNHDGKLTGAEILAENRLRLQRDGAQAAPVRDWNGDGSVDLSEFSNAAHAYFTTLDTKNAGELRVADLRDPSLIRAYKPPALESPAADPNYNPAETVPGSGYGY
jgi:phosphate-selective porin